MNKFVYLLYYWNYQVMILNSTPLFPSVHFAFLMSLIHPGIDSFYLQVLQFSFLILFSLNASDFHFYHFAFLFPAFINFPFSKFISRITLLSRQFFPVQIWPVQVYLYILWQAHCTRILGLWTAGIRFGILRWLPWSISNLFAFFKYLALVSYWDFNILCFLYLQFPRPIFDLYRFLSFDEP